MNPNYDCGLEIRFILPPRCTEAQHLGDQGAFFYEAMQQQTIFEPSMITMIKIGEEVNQLDRIFAQLSKQYESELEYHSGILVSVLEPVMILILALMVSVILIAMYLPMFKIGTVIH